MPASKRADTPRRPALSMGCAISDAVQDGSNHRVGLQTCESTNELDGVRVGDEPVLPRAHFVEANLRMVAASPVHEQLRLSVVSGHNNLHEQGAEDALFELWRALWLLPQPPQICAER